ncbi:MAG: right-handed parallel beta-helix repeat-containing protein [Lentisphaerae bacterium]|nr:right-handed parallel beta-helix repeat-containing protein [Lentisphaerota bacterium]
MQGATYYVSPTGSDANNGTSWDFAKQTIQAGINVATSGDTVLVVDGTYSPISISPGIAVRSVNGAQATTIDGGGVMRCAYLNTNAVLDGFTVTNGYAPDYGGGVYALGGTIQNCTISGNAAYYYYSYSNASYYYGYYNGYAGGVFASGSTVTNCTITGNTAGDCGGIYTYASTIQNCTISENSAYSYYYYGSSGYYNYYYDGYNGYAGGVYADYSTVENCTISGNMAYDVGGMSTDHSTVNNCMITGNAAGEWGWAGGIDVWACTVKNCTISGNKAAWGGGVGTWDGTVQDCTISGNLAFEAGGGVAAYGNSTVRNSMIIDNGANWGGGVQLLFGGIVQDCTIDGNWVNYGGGGVLADRGSLVQDCQITGNSTLLAEHPEYVLAYWSCGGGVLAWQSTVRGCTFEGNWTADFGGGVYAVQCTIQDCVIQRNGAFFDGGGVEIWSSTLRNCLIAGNSANDFGGGVHSSSSTVQNCTISGNWANDGGGLYSYDSNTVRNCIAYYNHNGDVRGIVSNISHSCFGIEIPGIGNITSEPQFMTNGTDYGTNHVPGDYYLQPTSPCINVGTNQSWMINAVDLAGRPRILRGVVDMGTYEGSQADIIIMRSPMILSNWCGYGSNATGQTIQVWNPGAGAMAYALSSDVDWLSLSPANGMSTGEADLVSITYASAGLAPGTYTGIVTITSAEAINSPQVVTVKLLVNKLSQTITFPVISAQTATSRVVLVATASSGLPVSFTVTYGPGAITGGTNLTFTAAGTVYVVASQVGNAIYNRAPSVRNAVLVNKVGQTITFPAIPDQTVTSRVVLAAITSSGLPVRFAVVSGPGTITGGNNLSFSATGTVRVVASQTGNATYNPASDVTNAVVVRQASQTIAFPVVPIQTVTSQVALAATASSGLPVSFSVASGAGTITGATNLSFTATGIVHVAASQAGNSLWVAAAQVTNSVIVVNPPAGELRFAETNVVVDEDAVNVVLKVVRTNGNYGLISVEYADWGITASAGLDYGVVTGQLTWADGDASDKVITIPVVDDLKDESNEVFEVELTNAVGTGISGTNAASVTIVDNDGPGTVQFNVSSYSVNENGGTVTLTVTRTRGSSGPATVEYATSDGTAAVGSDYVAQGGTLSWADGEAGSKTITIAITDDSLDETDETFTVTLSNATGASLGSPASAIVTIVDNDDPSDPPEHQADLEVSDFKFEPVSLWAGDNPAEIEFVLVNDGPEDLVAPDVQLEISFFLSSNTTFGDEDDIAIGTTTEAITIGAGSQITIRYPGRAHNEDVTIPEGLSGDYYVFVSVRLRSQSGLSDPDGAYAMRDAPIRVRIHPAVNDYDGDRQSDMMVYYEPSGEWTVRLSGSDKSVRFIFGGPGFETVSGDYDGDGLADPAIHDRQGSAWRIMLSGKGYQTVDFDFGGAGATRGAVGDYTGEGRAHPGLYEETSGRWYVMLSEPGSGNAEIASAVFGGSGYLPVAGDYDGDRRTDPAVYGETTGQWMVMLSAQSYGVVSAIFGGPGYEPVVGDYDGDGRADPMLYEQATGTWQGLMSGNGYALKRFSSSAGVPVAGDFDGDGIADPAVLSTSGGWSFLSSAASYLRAGPYSLTSP